MIVFWIIAALMVAATLWALLRPLLRAGPRAEARSAYDIAVYRDQLKEVERDVERGLLGPDQARAARTEIERRMLAAADGLPDEKEDAASTEAPEGKARAARPVVVGLAVIVPAAALAIYLSIGAPNTPDLPLAERTDPARVELAERTEMARLIGQLAERLEEMPNQPEGWILLGRSYRTLEEYPKAADAFLRAAELTGRAPRILSEYAEALVLAENGTIPASAADVFREVVAREPTEPRARYFLGLYRVQEGDVRGALQEWVDLSAVSPAGAPWMAEVRQRIELAAAALQIDPESVTPTAGLPAPLPPTAPPAAARPSPPGDSAPALSGDDMEAAARISEEDREAMIRGMVEGLAERLEENPNDVAGWLRLARAYEVLGETEKAMEARARAEAAQTGAP